MVKRLFLISASAFLTLLGCSLLTGNTPLGSVPLFSDDFSNPDSGWHSWSEEETAAEYRGWEYVFSFYAEDASAWAWPGDQLTALADIHVQFAVRNPKQSAFFKFGTYCYYQDEDNFYLLMASTNGYFRVIKHVAGELTVLTPNADEDEWAASADIPKQASDYTFGADCAHGRLAVYVNENKIAEIEDASHTQGEVRLFGGYFGHETGEIHFDDFVVKKVEQP